MVPSNQLLLCSSSTLAIVKWQLSIPESLANKIEWTAVGSLKLWRLTVFLGVCSWAEEDWLSVFPASSEQGGGGEEGGREEDGGSHASGAARGPHWARSGGAGEVRPPPSPPAPHPTFSTPTLPPPAPHPPLPTPRYPPPATQTPTPYLPTTAHVSGQ